MCVSVYNYVCVGEEECVCEKEGGVRVRVRQFLEISHLPFLVFASRILHVDLRVDKSSS